MNPNRTSILRTSGVCRIYKNGNTAIIYLNTIIAESGTGWNKIADIPEGYKPNSEMNNEGYLHDNFLVQVRANGIYCYSPIQAKELEGQITYFTK